MTDSPDWQVYANAQSANLFTAFTQVLAPGMHHGQVLAAQSWSSLIVIASPSAGAAKITVTHYADQAGTQAIDSDTWPVNAATRLVVRTPLRGPYVRLDINVTSAVSLTAETWASYLNASSERISFPVSNQNVSDFSHTLAAGQTITYTYGEITAGMSLFYFLPYSNSAQLEISIHAVDELGNPGQLIAEFGQPAALIQQLITIPDVITQVQVTNKDNVNAHSYDFSLTTPPQ